MKKYIHVYEKFYEQMTPDQLLTSEKKIYLLQEIEL